MERLTEPGRLGWAALATALYVGPGLPDYSVDSTGWRAHAPTHGASARSAACSASSQAEHDLLVCLKSFPTAMNLRLIVDSQQRLSRRSAILAERTCAPRAESWSDRAVSYSVLKQHLRKLGGRIGKGVASSRRGRHRDSAPSSTAGRHHPRTAGRRRICDQPPDRVPGPASARVPRSVGKPGPSSSRTLLAHEVIPWFGFIPSGSE